MQENYRQNAERLFKSHHWGRLASALAYLTAPYQQTTKMNVNHSTFLEFLLSCLYLKHIDKRSRIHLYKYKRYVSPSTPPPWRHQVMGRATVQVQIWHLVTHMKFRRNSKPVRKKGDCSSGARRDSDQACLFFNRIRKANYYYYYYFTPRCCDHQHRGWRGSRAHACPAVHTSSLASRRRSSGRPACRRPGPGRGRRRRQGRPSRKNAA